MCTWTARSHCASLSTRGLQHSFHHKAAAIWGPDCYLNTGSQVPMGGTLRLTWQQQNRVQSELSTALALICTITSQPRCQVAPSCHSAPLPLANTCAARYRSARSAPATKRVLVPYFSNRDRPAPQLLTGSVSTGATLFASPACSWYTWPSSEKVDFESRSESSM